MKNEIIVAFVGIQIKEIIEEPTPLQTEILSVFGYKIKGVVLQKISR